MPVGLVHGVEQAAHDDPAEGRRGLEHVERDLHEHVQLAAGEVARPEGRPGDEVGVGGGAEPAGVLGGVLVDAGIGLLDRTLEGAREVARQRAVRVLADGAEQLAHLVLWRHDAAAQGAERLLGGGQVRVPQHVGEQAGDEAAPAFAEELGAGRAGQPRLAADPADDGVHLAFGERRGGVDPVQGVEAPGRGVGGVEGDNLVAEVPLPVASHHRPHLARGVEHDGGAGPGEQGGDAGRGGLKAARPGEDEGVGGGRAARVDEQRRLAAHAPGAPVGGVEGAALGGAVLVHAVRLADDQAAIGGVRPREQLTGTVHAEPVGVAEVVGAAAQQGRAGLAANGPGAGGDAPADEGHEQAGDDGELVREAGLVEQHERRVARDAEVGAQAHPLGPGGEQGGGGHAGDARHGHGAGAGAAPLGGGARAPGPGGAEQGDGGPGGQRHPVAGGPGTAGLVGREGQQEVGPPAIGQVPGPPEQPQGPELDEDAQADAEQVVAGPLDHAAASASSAATGPDAAPPTRRAEPPWALARASASS